MKCPICGTTVPAGAERCTDCGFRCQNPSATTTDTSAYTMRKPSRPRGLKTCGCCFGVFAVILLVTVLLAASFTALVEFSDSGVMQREPEYPTESAMPDTESILPEPEHTGEASEDCFSIHGGAVTFREEAWDGGSVLEIPDTVAGEKVTALAPGCFRNCEELTTIILPESVTRINRAAFEGCKNLRGLFIPEGCTTVGADAFDGCVSMEAVYIPSTMASIPSGTFDDCIALLLIFYSGDYDAWCSLYNDFITPFTTAICLDGSYYHGVP